MTPDKPQPVALLIFLSVLFAYDLSMFWSVHQHQWSLPEIATSYDPLHPWLPKFGAPEVTLPMNHLQWMVVFHGMGSAFPLVGGLIQLLPAVRSRFPRFHRYNGRLVLLTTAVFAALPGLFLAMGISHASLALRAVVFFMGILVLIAIAQTWRAARAGKMDMHMRWGLRFVAYLHVIPVLARLYFWALWVSYSATNGPIAEPAAQSWTFEIIGWITAFSVVPVGEALVWFGTRAETQHRAPASG